MTLLVDSTDTAHWAESALCAQTDPDLFFPGDGDHGGRAKAVCRKCDVQPECLADALARGEQHGVWGGLTVEERRKLPGYVSQRMGR